jgi:hypothetical protein
MTLSPNRNTTTGSARGPKRPSLSPGLLTGGQRRQHRQTKGHRALSKNDFDSYRALFLKSGLMYGRSFGSKSCYARNNPVRFFLANACVLTPDRECVWRGDLDLATAADREGLLNASRLLRRKLYVLREGMEDKTRSLPRTWLTENAVVAVWRGNVATVGYTHCLHGTLEQAIARSSGLPPGPLAMRGYARTVRADAPRRTRDQMREIREGER